MSEQSDHVRDEIRDRWDPDFEWVQNDFIPWAHPRKSLENSRVALISLAGVYLKNQFHEPFASAHPHGDPSFREFPARYLELADLGIAHAHYDSCRAEEDLNVVFPLDRLRELANSGVIGEVAPFAYSFMGHVTRPLRLLAEYIPNVVERLRRAEVDLTLLGAVSPVCHQSAGLIARALESAGISTLVAGVNPDLLELVRPPRAVWSPFPAGATFGKPGNATQQQDILKDMFAAFYQMHERGSVWRLPHRWQSE